MVQKSMEERVVVVGSRESWLTQFSERLVQIPGFKAVTVDPALFQVAAKYKKGTVWGDLLATFTPGSDGTEVALRSSAHVDNIYALFSSPNRKLLEASKQALR